jgi:hydrogenase maturation protease
MRTLLIAFGNPLCHDDGVAHAVLELFAADRVESRRLSQLTPEVAADIAGFAAVVFADADATTEEVVLEALKEPAPHGALTHTIGPSEVVALSRMLFGFAGTALLCRIPANDFSPGEGLSPHARSFVPRAEQILKALLNDRRIAAKDCE